MSGLAAGEIVDHFGYSATFLALGAAALWASSSSWCRCRKLPNWRRYRRLLEFVQGPFRPIVLSLGMSVIG